MFELTKIYTCNGCATVATEIKAKKWTHVNNNPNDGKLSMDFCPDCYDKISVLFNAQSVPVKPAHKTAKKQESVAETIGDTESSVTDEIIAEPVEEPVPIPTKSKVPTKDIIEKEAEQFINFYKQLYARALYAIACDDDFSEVTKYVKLLPGHIKVDLSSDVDNQLSLAWNELSLVWNEKKVYIKRASAKSTATEIRICKGTSTILTRKVSKFSAIQTLINDTSQSAASLMPVKSECFSCDYIQDKLEDIECAINDGEDFQELKEWIQFVAIQNSIELT